MTSEVIAHWLATAPTPQPRRLDRRSLPRRDGPLKPTRQTRGARASAAQEIPTASAAEASEIKNNRGGPTIVAQLAAITRN